MLETDLPEPGLPHDGQRAAEAGVVAEVADGVDQALVTGEPDTQVADLQDHVAVGGGSGVGGQVGQHGGLGAHESLTRGSMKE